MNTIDFIKSLKSGDVELNNLKSKITWNNAKDNNKENIYFLSGVKDGMNKRAKDKDIVSKKYFCIDIDLRNQVDYNISNDDIKQIGIEMSESLSDLDEQLGQWRHIVFSGNGLHVYYEIEDKQYDPAIYAAGVEVIYNNWNEAWGDPTYYADKACKNIARILRLPGSINQKNGARVEILASQEVVADMDIAMLGETQIMFDEAIKQQEIDKRAKEYEKQMKMEKLIGGDDDVVVDKAEANKLLFAKIDAIPAYIVSEKLHPQFKFWKNSRNFLSDTKKGNQFTAFYYSDRLNGIVNGGSHFYAWGDDSSVYSPSVLVKNELGLDWKQTVKWFKSNFKIA